MAKEADRVEKPSDCAIAVAIPTTLEEFKYCWNDPDREFPQLIFELMGIPALDNAWKKVYEQLIAEYWEIRKELIGRGVMVVERAGRRDVSESLCRFPVVSVMAHSPYPPLSIDDVLQPDLFLAAFGLKKSGRKTEGNAIIEWLCKQPEIKRATNVPTLVGGLNQLIERGRKFFHDPPEGFDDHHQASPQDFERSNLPACVTRMHLYMALPTVFRAPNILELYDGAIDFASLAELIPKTYSGTIDFLNCSSLWFTEDLRKVRATPAAYLALKQLAFVDEWLKLYLFTIRYLDYEPMLFVQARLRVHRDLMRSRRQA